MSASVSGKRLPVVRVVSDYLAHPGRVCARFRANMVRRVNAALRLPAPLTAADIFLQNPCEADVLAPAFLERFAPGFAAAYAVPETTPAVRRQVIVRRERNELVDAAEAALYASEGFRRLAKPPRMRVPLHLVHAPGAQVVLAGGQCCVLTPDGARTIAEISTRTFPRALLEAPAETVDAPLVLIPDLQGATNFSHLLYDCVPRIIDFARLRPGLARKALYVMGPERRPIHDLVLAQVQARFGIPPAQFLFGRDPRRLTSRAGVFGFTSARIPTHPMRRGHAGTVAQFRDWSQRLPIGDSPLRKVYVTRRDATRRRLLNEAALLPELARRGFAVVALAELSLADQLAVMAHADVILGPHGMGMTFHVFSRRQPAVVEIYDPRIGTVAYRIMARAFGFQHGYCFGTPPPGEPPAGSAFDCTVDPAAVFAALDALPA